MWNAVIILAVLASLAGFAYLISRIGKFNFISRISKGSKAKSIIYSCLIVLIFITAIFFIFGYVNLCIILVHLTVFWLLSEAMFLFIRKYHKAIANSKVYLAGIVALAVTALYLTGAWINDRNVVITKYSVSTDKDVEPLKIVMFSDSHLGVTFDGKGFEKYADTISGLEPDLVLFVGDYVDGSSKYEDMVTATRAFGQISSKYGSYFVFGNHDQNIYGEDNYRDFTEEMLHEELVKNGIHVLEDEIMDLGNGYEIIGRRDKDEESRQSILELVEKANKDDFLIDLNHQPNDYDSEEAAGLDLVLSGHTHGGQLIPINKLGEIIGANDNTYGYVKRADTNFIVSSGISDWAADFKTGCKSEIVVIEIIPQEK